MEPPAPNAQPTHPTNLHTLLNTNNFLPSAIYVVVAFALAHADSTFDNITDQLGALQCVAQS
jgi:hypothetical protein